MLLATLAAIGIAACDSGSSSSAGGGAYSSGGFSIDSDVQQFELRPGTAAHPWLAEVLVERSDAVYYDWDERQAALKTFFAALGGNDLAGLASVQVESGQSTLTPLGPFTNDGSSA